jgi:ADP-dependent NAD(P)H-hydrate dehydratase
MLPIQRRILQQLLIRNSNSHKYDYGRVLVIGGNQSMAGAPVLAGRAALRSGAGVVELCVPRVIASIAAGFDSCLITHGLSSDASGCFAADSLQALRTIAARADIIVFGPGLGRSTALSHMVKTLWREIPQIAIFDADALFALSEIETNDLKQHAGIRILTPHTGEMQRLLARVGESQHSPISINRDELELAASNFACESDSIIVLKGPQTFITDGVQHWHNNTGNPGMATAGSGDVLSGVIAALLAQGLTAIDAAKLGVWVHGLAGDAAAQARTEISMIATDLIDFLPDVYKQLQRDVAEG